MTKRFGVCVCFATMAAVFLAAPAWCQGRNITPDDYYAMLKASDPQISPDGRMVLYVVRRADRKLNKRINTIWLAYSDGSREPRPLTNGVDSSDLPRWSPDGKSFAFLSALASAAEGQHGAKTQVQILSLDGGEPRTVTSLKNGVELAEFSPDGSRLVCVSRIGPSDSVPDNAEKSDTRHYVHATYKLNATGFLDDRREHLWVVDVKTGSAKQITSGDDWNDTEPQWSPDGMRILFSSDRSGKYWEDLIDSQRAIWVVSAEGGTPEKSSGDMMVVGGGGQWSPDGRSIAFFGAQSKLDDRKLYVIAPDGQGKPRQVVSGLDEAVHALQWEDSGRSLVWLSNHRGEYHAFRAKVDSGAVSQVTSGARFLETLNVNDKAGLAAYTISAFTNPSELYVSNLDGRHEVRLTHLNEDWLKQVTVQPVERMSYTVQDGFTEDGFVVKPVGWQQGKKYPVILLIHGGPDSMYGTTFMFQVQVLAAQGWGVFYSNFRGSVGYGTKFTQAANLELGGKVYTDILTGLDAALKQNSWMDADKLGLTGCSFGGYMTNWIVSHTDRFKAGVPMCSISDYVSDEGTRDVYYGHSMAFGGDLYQNFDLFWKYSPVHYAMNVKTPLLILHGEVDNTVPLEQAEQWFRALHHFHVPSELVIFPHENHAGLYSGQPHHVVEALQWQTYWFQRYLDGNSGAVPPDALAKESRQIAK